MIDLTPEPLLALRALARTRVRSGRPTALPGGQVVRARGRGLETADLRAFQYGDDPRHVDRNATARTGQLQARTFHAERDSTTLLIADFRPCMLWGTRRTLRSVAAAEALSLFGWQAVLAGARVGLVAVAGGELAYRAAAGRDRAMVGVIGTMVALHRRALGRATDPDPPLQETLERARRLAPKGAQIVLASAMDHPGSGFADRVAELRNDHAFRIVRIADAFETEPPAGVFRFQTADGTRGAARARLSAEDSSPALISATYRAHLPPDSQAGILHG